MNFKQYTLLFLSSLLLAPILDTKACGYYDDESQYTAMMFRAVPSEMASMRPFFYASSSRYDWQQPLISDENSTDRHRNCVEWLAQCDKTVSIDDILLIQYETSPAMFEAAYKSGSWNEYFPNNTFIQFLIKPNNKALLDYMLLAKQVEETEVGNSSKFEDWDNVNRYYNNSDDDVPSTPKGKLYATALERIDKTSNKFLKERYAFQLCRFYYQFGSEQQAIETYNKYFGTPNPKSLMNTWSLLFCAMSTDILDNHHEANRLYTHVFMNSNEKKHKIERVFNSTDSIADSFSNREKSIANTIIALRNPSKCIDLIVAANEQDASNPYIPFLVMREINKLEDWLITPVFFDKYSVTSGDPFRCAYINPWVKEDDDNENSESEDTENTEARLQAENLATDTQYLTQLKTLVQKLHSSAKGETRDFYSISLAHLSLLQENAGEAQKYLNMISAKANPSILLQKNIENIWIAIRTKDIHSREFKSIFTKNIADLERVKSPGFDNQKMLYTLTLSLANEYLKIDDRVYGNLMRMKADEYNGTTYWWYNSSDSYYLMQYFDRNANISDMNKLIALLEDDSKSEYDTYLCNQRLNSIDGYKDLKGTIALRNNDLQLAHSTFASMHQDYWAQTNLSYHNYLNEDPFKPKGLGRNKDRRFDYKFNKTDFVQTLIDLEKKGDTESYIQLGNAYFNMTYWGNSWLMTSYAWSTYDTSYSNVECLPQWMQNYMTASRAADFYKKALKSASTNEQKAYTNLMLHYINRLDYSFVAKNLANKYKQSALDYRTNFDKFRQTSTYKTYNCSGIEYFLTGNASRN